MMLRADCIISTAGIMTLRRVGLLALNQMLIRQSLMMESVYIALMFMLIVGIILSHTKMLAENLLFLYLYELARFLHGWLMVLLQRLVLVQVLR